MKKTIWFYPLIIMGVLLMLTSSFKKDGNNNNLKGGEKNVTDIDGNVYHTVTIGTQTWLVENLKVIRYNNGNAIPNVSDEELWGNLTTGAYCNYKNIASNADIYGRLYNWHAVNDSRNICPAGWHVPTDAEWTTLETYVGGSKVAGNKLKEAGTSHWQKPNTGANNSSGFTAILTGYRGYNGIYYVIGPYDAFWWSTTEYNAYGAWYRSMNSNKSEVSRQNKYKPSGFSVRCLQN